MSQIKAPPPRACEADGMELLTQLAVASATAGTTALAHLVGLGLFIEALQAGRGRLVSPQARSHQALMVLGIGLGLFVLHALEIWLYAAVYLLVGEFGRLDDALYFSTSSYSTVGYGDLLLSRHWRVLGAIEGVNGVILLGWSTAFFVSMVQKLRALEEGWRLFARAETPP
jgi:hypothetical protein